nr:CBS domain-containing protein [uncultured Pedobacter sp.]
MKPKSIIINGEFSFPANPHTTVLHPDQIIIDALATFIDLRAEFLLVQEHGKCIGIIYCSDLIDFLNYDEPNGALLAHKINFDLRSAVIAMNKS